MAWVCLVAAAFAVPVPFMAAPGGGVSFHGESSVGPVLGRVDVFSASLDLDAGTGAFVADAASLTTGLGPRDQRMLVYALDVATFPEVRFDVQRVDRPRDASPNDGPVSLVGTLSVHGVTLPLTVAATATTEGGKLRLRGDVPLTLADYTIPDPSVVIATFSPTVHVTFDVVGDLAP